MKGNEHFNEMGLYHGMDGCNLQFGDRRKFGEGHALCSCAQTQKSG